MATVLLVDDDPDNRQLLTVWLQKMEHQVLSASSAVEALQRMDEQGIPDVAVLDIVMEQISGLDLLDHLRRYDPLTAELPAILITARQLASDRDEASALNALLVTKPVTRTGLAAAIDRLLQPAGA